MILEGHVMDRLRELPDRSVQCAISSPPFYGLRDYGTGGWEGGDEACDHYQGRDGAGRADGRVDDRGQRNRDGIGALTSGVCAGCGATRLDDQIGLEPTPEAYVEKLVEVFREVARVLRDDGTLWLNLGDSYNAAGRKGHGTRIGYKQQTNRASANGADGSRSTDPAAKPKDLLMIPARVALALQADGWYLRSDIIWAKPNPMPESVTDRPTSAHEHVFLLTKSARYYYDDEAIREEGVNPASKLPGRGMTLTEHYGAGNGGNGGLLALRNRLNDAGSGAMGRNKRNVWTVATQPFPGAHFAVFPPALVEPMVLAGSSPQACGECGAPWERVVEREQVKEGEVYESRMERAGNDFTPLWQPNRDREQVPIRYNLSQSVSTTTGWRPLCGHADGSGRGVVLDPFAGSGTVGVVAAWYGREFIGIELNPEYARMARERIDVEGRLRRSAYRPEPEPETQAALW